MQEQKFNKKRIFNPNELYLEYFSETKISPQKLSSFLHNETVSPEDLSECVKGFSSFVNDAMENNSEIDDDTLFRLNMMTLMFTGLIQNNENKNNQLPLTPETQKIAFSALNNLLLSRNVDPELLVDVLSVGKGLEDQKENNTKYSDEANKVLKDYLSMPDIRTLLFAKFKFFKESGVYDELNYKKKKVSILERTKEYLDLDLDNKDLDFENPDSLRTFNDINMNHPLYRVNRRGKFASIQEEESNLFFKTELNIRDKKYWERKYEECLKSNGFEEVGFADNVVQKTKMFFAKEYEDNGSIFSRNIRYRSEDGTSYMLLEIPRGPFKSVNVPSMPNNDKTYELMAISARMQGIKKPVVNCYEKNPDDRKEFVEKTIQQLIAQGYDINDIGVPKDCIDCKEKFKQLAQGLYDANDENVQSKLENSNIVFNKEESEDASEQNLNSENSPNASPLEETQSQDSQNNSNSENPSDLLEDGNVDMGRNMAHSMSNDMPPMEQVPLPEELPPESYHDDMQYENSGVGFSQNSFGQNNIPESKPPVPMDPKDFRDMLHKLYNDGEQDVSSNKLLNEAYTSLSKQYKVVNHEGKQLSPKDIGVDVATYILVSRSNDLINEVSKMENASDDLKASLEKLPKGINEVDHPSSYALYEAMEKANEEGVNIDFLLNGEISDPNSICWLTIGDLVEKTPEELEFDRQQMSQETAKPEKRSKKRNRGYNKK